MVKNWLTIEAFSVCIAGKRTFQCVKISLIKEAVAVGLATKTHIVHAETHTKNMLVP